MTHLTFPNGDRMPLLGLGTWKSRPGEVGAAVAEALALGWRHLDCAPIYGNEPEVGEALEGAIAAGTVRREEVWLTSKLWNNAHTPEAVEPALRQTLRDLRVEQLDLFLIHWPVIFRPGVLFPQSAEEFLPLEACPLADTWAAMEAVREAGLCRHIGVSNLSATKLAALAGQARSLPEVNQVEMHPYLQQPGLVAWCEAHGVHLTAYSPLGSPDRPGRQQADAAPVLLEDPVVRGIAVQRGASPAQVLLAWSLQRGVSAIPKSVSPTRLAENLQAQAVQLTAADMAALAGLDRHARYISGDVWTPPGSPYTLANLWDE
ncbi:MAG: aldo/keto reductase [Candidatus Sericytochromatia bacterium]|nr:aldo/keto reductase [Candidatus Sericytochromatia bacterium]